MLQGLLIAILVQSLILAALCFTVRKGDAANRWLGTYFLTIAFQRVFHIVLRNTDWLYQHPWWVCTYEVSVLLGVFAMHRFVLQLLGQPFRAAQIAFYAISILFLSVFSIGFLSGYWSGVQAYYHHWFSTAVSGSACIYTMAVASDCLRRIGKSLSKPDFDDPRLRLTLNAARWLLYYLVFRSGLTLAFIAVRATAMKDLALLFRLEESYLLAVNVLLIIVLALMAYFALRNPVFFDHFLDKKPGVEQQIVLAVLPENERQIIRPSIAAEELDAIAARLRLLMEQEKPWLDPKLTQSKLAEHLGLPPYKLGLALHQGFGQHFNEFVNAYRVAQAQDLLADPGRTRDTMYAVALDSGFASEAPFYAAFKKLVGQSPAAWREAKKSS